MNARKPTPLYRVKEKEFNENCPAAEILYVQAGEDAPAEIHLTPNVMVTIKILRNHPEGMSVKEMRKKFEKLSTDSVRILMNRCVWLGLMAIEQNPEHSRMLIYRVTKLGVLATRFYEQVCDPKAYRQVRAQGPMIHNKGKVIRETLKAESEERHGNEK